MRARDLQVEVIFLEIIRPAHYHSFINNRILFLIYFRRLLSQKQLGSFLVREVQLRVLRQDLQDLGFIEEPSEYGLQEGT